MPFRVTAAKSGSFTAEVGVDKFMVSLNTKTGDVTLKTNDSSETFSGKANVEVLSEKNQAVYTVIRPETDLSRVNVYTMEVTSQNGVQTLSRIGRESVAIGDRNGSSVMTPFSGRRVANGTAVSGRMGKDDFKFSIDPSTGLVRLGEGAGTEFKASLEIHKRTDFKGKETVYHTYTVLRPATWLTDLDVYQFTFVQGPGGLKLDSVGRESVRLEDANGSPSMPFTVEAASNSGGRGANRN